MVANAEKINVYIILVVGKRKIGKYGIFFLPMIFISKVRKSANEFVFMSSFFLCSLYDRYQCYKMLAQLHYIPKATNRLRSLEFVPSFSLLYSLLSTFHVRFRTLGDMEGCGDILCGCCGNDTTVGHT